MTFKHSFTTLVIITARSPAMRHPYCTQDPLPTLVVCILMLSLQANYQLPFTVSNHRTQRRITSIQMLSFTIYPIALGLMLTVINRPKTRLLALRLMYLPDRALLAEPAPQPLWQIDDGTNRAPARRFTLPGHTASATPTASWNQQKPRSRQPG